MNTSLVPPLVDGGIMLSYHCTNACRHCAYRCSPARPDEWMEPKMIEKVFKTLSAERRLNSVHLAGGEATLRMDVLGKALDVAAREGVRISYLETNGHFATSQEEAGEVFSSLKEKGLNAVLISASPFHNEFIPFERTRTAVNAATEVFGEAGVLVWISDMYRAMAALPEDRTNTLDEFLSTHNIAHSDIPTIYPITPHGRAVETLRSSFPLKKAKEFSGDSCGADLFDTTHFHIDRHGNLFTGHCAGIIATTVDNLHPPVSPVEHPTMLTCFDSGPFSLMQKAQKYGYKPREEGYAGKCDLCMDVRKHLFHNAPDKFPDIGPEDFYGL